MRKIIHFVHTSLDGYIEGPGGEFDWPVMGPDLSAYSFSQRERADTFLYGRPVWEMMAGYWPNAESISDDRTTSSSPRSGAAATRSCSPAP